MKSYLSKYGTAKDFLTRFAPDKQAACAKFPEACVLRDCPTLVDARNMYGQDTAELWLAIELRDASEFARTERKPEPFEIDECARTLYSQFYHLKISELLLFFAKFKGGAYGKFYGEVDLLTIGEAMQKFLKSRRDLISRAEEKERAERAIEERTKRGGCCTREEYNGMEQVEIPVRVIVDTPALQEALHPRRHGVNDDATITIPKDRLADVWKFVENGQISVLR